MHSGRPTRRPTSSSRCASRRRPRRCGSSTSSSPRSTATTSPIGRRAITRRRSARSSRSSRRKGRGVDSRLLGVEEEALQTVLGARPDVFNHNIETVRRLHRAMRGGKADYDRALWLLQRAKEIADYRVLTKSGIIVGLGETNEEVVETIRDLRAHGVDVVTIGQYLQPSPSTRRSTVGCTPTSSAGSASKAKRSASARSSPAHSSARAIARTRAARGRDRPRRRRVLERIPASATGRSGGVSDPCPCPCRRRPCCRGRGCRGSHPSRASQGRRGGSRRSASRDPSGGRSRARR